MFGLKKKKSTQGVGGSPQSPRVKVEDDIYVMPEKFNPRQKVGGSNKLLLTVVIILVVVAVSSAGYFLYDMWQQNSTDQRVVVETNTNTEQEPVNQGSDTNAQPISPVTPTPPVIIDNNDDEDDNPPDEDINDGTPEPVLRPMVPPQKSSDADRDGLTDLEEALIGTSATRPDSDGDGYLDGEEVLNGFNPVVSAGQSGELLVEADFIEVLNTNFSQNNYQLLTIKEWNHNMLVATQQAIITAGTGEIIKVSVRDNPDKLSPANWYLRQHSQVVLSDITNISVGDLSGIISPTGLEVYLTDLDRNLFYTFEYLIDQDAQFRYPTIFRMIVNSFKPMATATVPPQTATNNTATATTSGDVFEDEAEF